MAAAMGDLARGAPVADPVGSSEHVTHRERQMKSTIFQLRDIDEEVVQSWKKHFKDMENVSISNGDIFELKADAKSGKQLRLHGWRNRPRLHDAFRVGVADAIAIASEGPTRRRTSGRSGHDRRNLRCRNSVFDQRAHHACSHECVEYAQCLSRVPCSHSCGEAAQRRQRQENPQGALSGLVHCRGQNATRLGSKANGDCVRGLCARPDDRPQQPP